MDPELLLTAACFLGGALLGASAAAVLRREAVPGARPLPVEAAEAPVVAPRATRTLAPALMGREDQERLEALRNRRNTETASGSAYGPASDAHIAELKRLARAEVPVAWQSEWTLWHAGISFGGVLAFWGTDRCWHAGFPAGESVLAGGGLWCGAPRLRDALRLLAEQSPEAAEAVRALEVSHE